MAELVSFNNDTMTFESVLSFSMIKIFKANISVYKYLAVPAIKISISVDLLTNIFSFSGNAPECIVALQEAFRTFKHYCILYISSPNSFL